MKKEIVVTSNAPKAIGPYFQAIKIGDFLFTSGQLPIDPATDQIPKTIEDQTKQALENLQAVLDQSGSCLEKLVKTTVYLKNMNDFKLMNKTYSAFFKGHYCARSCVGVAMLPRDALVEIEAIASL